jgi:hypothetical protein
MVSAARGKLSEILKEMAWTLLRQPNRPSSEAAQAALLLAHVAWGRSLGAPKPERGYRQVLAVLEADRPTLWEEMTDSDPDAIIASLVRLKEKRYPLDDRVIAVCGMLKGNVHVEWREGSDVRDAQRIVGKQIERLVELIAAGKEDEAVEHLCQTTRLSWQEAKRHVRRVRKAMEGGGQ